MYMEYMNTKNLKEINKKLCLNPHYNIDDLSRLENALLYWGKTYEENFKDISIKWIEKEYKKMELSKRRRRNQFIRKITD